MRIPVQCAPLDELIHGGVETGAVTEFFGEAGAGKTNVCLQLARNVAREGRKVIYIDTEGVSLERLQQITGADYRTVYSNILFFEPYSLKEQEAMIEKACRLATSTDVALVVLDSATLHYRIALASEDGQQGRRNLAAQLQSLVAVARKKDISVVTTNQVYTNVEKEMLEPIGGQIMRHLSKAVIQLEKAGIGRRRAMVMKHRAVPEGVTADFHITTDGLSGAPEGGSAFREAAEPEAEPVETSGPADPAGDAMAGGNTPGQPATE